MATEKRRILTKDLFAIDETGRVVIKDRVLADRIREALAAQDPERPLVSLVEPDAGNAEV